MPAERYFVEQELQKQSRITLEGAEQHHLVHVMRSKVGENVELIDGMGNLAQATVEHLGKREAVITVDAVKHEKPSKRRLVLIQAIPRLNRLDTIVEKGTELGMAELHLWPSTLSDRKSLTDQQLSRLRQVAIAATKQCGRLYLPPIHILDPIERWSPFVHTTFFGDTYPAAPWLSEVYKGEDCTIIIGPESGLTVDETEQLRALGATGIKLHENILRTDTAGIVALSVCSQSTTPL